MSNYSRTDFENLPVREVHKPNIVLRKNKGLYVLGRDNIVFYIPEKFVTEDIIKKYGIEHIHFRTDGSYWWNEKGSYEELFDTGRHRWNLSLFTKILSKVDIGTTLEELINLKNTIKLSPKREERLYTEFECNVIGKPRLDIIRGDKKHIDFIHVEVLLSTSTTVDWVKKHKKEIDNYILEGMKRNSNFKNGTYDINWFKVSNIVFRKAFSTLIYTFEFKGLDIVTEESEE